MADITEPAAELRNINLNLEKLNKTIQNSATIVYRGIISAAKIQSAQNDYQRNTAIKEADDFLDEINQIWRKR